MSSAIDGPVERNNGNRRCGRVILAGQSGDRFAQEVGFAALPLLGEPPNAAFSSSGRYTVVFTMPYVYHTSCQSQLRGADGCATGTAFSGGIFDRCGTDVAEEFVCFCCHRFH